MKDVILYYWQTVVKPEKERAEKERIKQETKLKSKTPPISERRSV